MTDSIYDFKDYREFLITWINLSNKKGLKSLLAKKANVSSTLISLILKGKKNLSLEQATDLAEYIGLNDLETEYFINLIEIDTSGTLKLKNFFLKKQKIILEKTNKISNRVKKNIVLSDAEKAIYYSSWIFTGIRNLVAVEGFDNSEKISEQLNIPINTVNQCLDFLIQNNLCIKKESKITYGPAHTHLDSDSPFVLKHHNNWRIRGLLKMDDKNQENLFYTCPMSLSVEAAEEIRKLLPSVIEKVMKIAGPSKSEKVMCLNMDWYSY